jgi:hypothetical protein
VALSETVEPVGTARLLAGPELELKVVDEDEGELWGFEGSDEDEVDELQVEVEEDVGVGVDDGVVEVVGGV